MSRPDPRIETPIGAVKGRRRRGWLALIGVGLLAAAAGAGAATAHAAEPEELCHPSLSTVPPCVPLSPDGSIAYRVTIICNGPIAGSLVEIRFNTVGDTLACWCFDDAGPRPHFYSERTNVLGVAEFFIRGGGCVEAHDPAIPGNEAYCGEVFADGVKMQEFGIVSPDVVDATGRRAVDTPTAWDPAGTCGSGLADAVAFTPSIASSAYDWCADINCDDAVTISDAVTLTVFLSGSIGCAGDAGP